MVLPVKTLMSAKDFPPELVKVIVGLSGYHILSLLGRFSSCALANRLIREARVAALQIIDFLLVDS